MEEVYFEISDSGNYVILKPIRLSYPESDDSWDQKWIQIKMELKGGCFQGVHIAEFMTDDFRNLKLQISKLYNNLNGSFDFNDLERNLELRMRGDGIGHFDVQVSASDNSVYNGTLTFTMQFDQTQIPGMVNQLEKIIAKYP